MPVPPHVTTLEDYWVWLDELVDRSSGHLDGFVLVVEPVLSDDEEAVSLIVPPQELHFWNDTTLVMSFSIDENLVVDKYTFHYMKDDGTLIWRKDNVHRHRGHRDKPHIHLRPGDQHHADSYTDVDPDEMLGEVDEYLYRGEVPRLL